MHNNPSKPFKPARLFVQIIPFLCKPIIIIATHAIYARAKSSHLPGFDCKNYSALSFLRPVWEEAGDARAICNTESCDSPKPCDWTNAFSPCPKPITCEFSGALCCHELHQLRIYRILQRPHIGNSSNSWRASTGAANRLIWARKYNNRQEHHQPTKAERSVPYMGNAGQ